MANWLNKHPDENLEKSLNLLVTYLPLPECSNAAAVALQVKDIYVLIMYFYLIIVFMRHLIQCNLSK